MGSKILKLAAITGVAGLLALVGCGQEPNAGSRRSTVTSPVGRHQ
jgi:hypothetical protein